MNAEIDTRMQSATRHCVIHLKEPEYSSHARDKLDRAGRLLDYAARHSTHPELIVDLSAVQYIGAAFLGLLVSTWDRLRQRGQRLVITGLTPMCLGLIQRANLDKLFEIHPQTPETNGLAERAGGESRHS